MANKNDDRDEKLGRAVAGFAYIFYAVKFILSVTVVALAVLFFIHKPLWLAPIIGVGVFLVYRLILTLIFRFAMWCKNLK